MIIGSAEHAAARATRSHRSDPRQQVRGGDPGYCSSLRRRTSGRDTVGGLPGHASRGPIDGLCGAGRCTGTVAGSDRRLESRTDPAARAGGAGRRFASAAALPGGPLEALRFVLGHLAERGRSLSAGQWVSTGAITGVHQIFPGQHGSIELIGHGRIDVRVNAAVAAGARTASGSGASGSGPRT
jgi:hypothetical protein